MDLFLTNSFSLHNMFDGLQSYWLWIVVMLLPVGELLFYYLWDTSLVFLEKKHELQQSKSSQCSNVHYSKMEEFYFVCLVCYLYLLLIFEIHCFMFKIYICICLRITSMHILVSSPVSIMVHPVGFYSQNYLFYNEFLNDYFSAFT